MTPEKAATLKPNVRVGFKIPFTKFGGIKFTLLVLINHKDIKSVEDFEDKSVTRNQGISISCLSNVIVNSTTPLAALCLTF